MEELYFIASLQILYRSQNLTHLEAELYDFQDCLLSTARLTSGQPCLLPIRTHLRNFYLRFINSDHEISELFSYFWPGDIAKEGTVSAAQKYDNFIIEIVIDIRENKQEERPEHQVTAEQQKQTVEQQEEVDPKKHLQGIKERVFEVLQGENFFAEENSRLKCNFVRKNKTHKNLTALLIKNSTNILKKINQNVNCSGFKTYSQLKTTQTNETADEIAIQLLPPLDKMKKTNSVQEPIDHWQETDSNYAILVSAPKRQENPRLIVINNASVQVQRRGNKSRPNKTAFYVKKKQGFQSKLEKETVTDLKNQKETLRVIQSYINGSFRLRDPQQRQRKSGKLVKAGNDNNSRLQKSFLAYGIKKV